MKQFFSVFRMRMASASSELFFCLGLALCAGYIPAIPPALVLPAGSALLCLATLMFWIQQKGSPLILVLLVIAAMLPMGFSPALAGLAVLPFAVLLDWHLKQRFHGHLSILVALGSLIFWVPQLYWLGEWFSSLTMKLATFPVGQELDWGSTTGPAPVLLFLLIYTISSLSSGRFGKAWMVPVSVLMFFVLLITWFFSLNNAPANILPWPPIALLCLSLLPTLFLVGEEKPSSGSDRFMAGRMAGAGGALLLFVLLWMNLPTANTSIDGVRIAFRDRGDWSWESTREGTRPGPRMGGLLDVLRSWGAEVSIVKDEQLLEDAADYDLVFVLHPTEALPANLTRSLYTFMDDGGALIVVGEHTNVHDIMKGVNSLLRNSSIRLKDDSAIPAWRGWNWNNDQRYLYNGSNKGLREANQFGISIGGSLKLKWPAVPLIQGTMAFSDRGNSENPRGKMGDNRYSWDERFGSLPLSAMQKFGKGTLYVLGDTSGMMSLSTPQVWPWYLNLTRSLVHSSGMGRSPLLSMILFLVLVACLYYASIAMDAGGRCMGLILLVVLVAPLSISMSKADVPPPVKGKDLCWIDYSHQPSFHSNSKMDWSVMSLVEACMNAGRLPLFMWDFNVELLKDCRWFLINGSARTWDQEESRDLRQWVESGGHLVIAGDARRSASLEILLEEFKLELQNTPLGTAPEGLDRLGRPVSFLFYEAWPVASTEGDLDTLLSCWDYPLIGDKRFGRGHVSLVGDEHFFTKYSLEGGERTGKPLNTARRFQQNTVSRKAPPPGNPAQIRYMGTWRDSLNRVAAPPPVIPVDRLEKRKQVIHGLLNLPLPKSQQPQLRRPFRSPGQQLRRRPPGFQPARPGVNAVSPRRGPIKHVQPAQQSGGGK